jgi:GntR family transcriptional regulator/MocR family aminotransferase
MWPGLITKQHQDRQKGLYHRAMPDLDIDLDRAGRTPLAIQIYQSVRGTVRVAYQRLVDEQFAIGLGAAGTRVAERPSRSSTASWPPDALPIQEQFPTYGIAPLPFQMGVPAQDAFPFKLWSRVLARNARRAAAVPVTYPDPRGDPQLRNEIATYLVIARGVRCSPSQVFITAGYSGALGLAVLALELERQGVWIRASPSRARR